jgi:hypothetical protein
VLQRLLQGRSLQGCHQGVTKALQYKNVTKALQYKNVTKVLRGDRVRETFVVEVFLGAAPLFTRGPTHKPCFVAHTVVPGGMTRVLGGCYESVTGVFREEIKGFRKVYQGCNKGVTRVLQGCYKGVTRV